MSNKTNWTPGPWVIKHISDAPPCGIVEVANHRYIYTEGRGFDEAASNAHLIAAAPELYEALINALAKMERDTEQIEWEWGFCRSMEELESDGALGQEITKARAALAKARGESK